jgi:hypothetical protein
MCALLLADIDTYSWSKFLDRLYRRTIEASATHTAPSPYQIRSYNSCSNTVRSHLILKNPPPFSQTRTVPSTSHAAGYPYYELASKATKDAKVASANVFPRDGAAPPLPSPLDLAFFGKL